MTLKKQIYADEKDKINLMRTYFIRDLTGNGRIRRLRVNEKTKRRTLTMKSFTSSSLFVNLRLRSSELLRNKVILS